jgi:hypothetical protein
MRKARDMILLIDVWLLSAVFWWGWRRRTGPNFLDIQVWGENCPLDFASKGETALPSNDNLTMFSCFPSKGCTLQKIYRSQN